MSHSQRKADRTTFEGPVAICRNKDAQVVRPHNLGAGGIYLTAPEALPVKSLVTLRIALPGQGGLTVLGRVVRAAAKEVAVEFLGLLPSQRARLENYVRASMPPHAAHAV